MTTPLPPFTNWTIDEPTAGHLVRLIREHRPNHVLECGSGLSTLLIAYAMLEYKNEGRHYALDENKKYANETITLLHKHGMGRPCVLHAPLTGCPPWYATRGLPIGYIVSEWRFDFVFVDGPISVDGETRRQPAMDRLWPMLADNAVILMDDAYRQQEIDAYEDWVRRFPLSLDILDTPRGAALLKRTGKEREDAGSERARQGLAHTQ